jgi:hypothetical protein
LEALAIDGHQVATLKAIFVRRPTLCYGDDVAMPLRRKNFVSMVLSAQDPEAAMPDPAVESLSTIHLSPVAPLGGSKWGASFAGPRLARRRRAVGAVWQNATIHPDGRVVAAAPDFGAIRNEAVIAVPAGEALSLGQFLLGPLTMATPGPQPDKKLALCGAPLTPRQTDVLARLGRLRTYIPIDKPQTFREVISVPLEPGTVPGPEICPLAESLRAPPTPRSGAVAILPRRTAEKFCLTNRASLTAWLRAKKIAIIEPESLRLADLTTALACAALVLLADPLQAGLLGLCHPGAKILEIAPEGWLGPEARCLSVLFGLDWTPFLAGPPRYPLQGGLPFGSLVPCSYEIPIRDLARALESHLTT